MRFANATMMSICCVYVAVVLRVPNQRAGHLSKKLEQPQQINACCHMLLHVVFKMMNAMLRITAMQAGITLLHGDMGRGSPRRGMMISLATTTPAMTWVRSPDWPGPLQRMAPRTKSIQGRAAPASSSMPSSTTLKGDAGAYSRLLTGGMQPISRPADGVNVYILCLHQVGHVLS